MDEITSTFDMMAACKEASLYLMGSSFVLGSLFTIFVLLVLDFVRRQKTGPE